MSGPAKIGDLIFTEFDVCFISSFYKDGTKYTSVLEYVYKNMDIDTEVGLTLRASLAKFEDNIDLINKLIDTKNNTIDYPYNSSKINYALILKSIRAYFQDENVIYNNCLTELNC
jgi:hypothetical protein